MGSVLAKCHKGHHEVEAAPDEGVDEAVEVEVVGGMTVNNGELKKVIEKGRTEIKEAQEKLNSSLTTPIVHSEAKVRVYSEKSDRGGLLLFEVIIT